MEIEKELKEALKMKRTVIGMNSVIRGIKSGAVKTVVQASNFPEELAGDLAYYKEVGSVNLEKFNGNSKQLGEFCGKPFNILAVGLKK